MTDKSIIFIIDGKDRSSGAPTDFRYTLSRLPIQSIEKFRINKIVIPYTWYSVEAQTFDVIYNTVTYPIAIEGGNYNSITLGNKVKSLIDTATGGSVSITWNADTNKYTFDAGAGNTLGFDFGAYAQRANYNVGVALGLVLPADVQVLIPPLQTYTSNYQSYLIATKSLYLRSQQLRTFNTSYFLKQPDNVIQTIPVNVNSYNMIIWQDAVEIKFFDDNKNLSQIDFQLVDDYGNTVSLNGYDFMMELQIYTTEEI